MTTVHVLTWDFDRETGVVVCGSRQRAIDEACEWLAEHKASLDEADYEDAVDELKRLGKVWIDDLELGYSIEEQEVLE